MTRVVSTYARSRRELLASTSLAGLGALVVVVLLGLFPGEALSTGGYHDAVAADNPVGYWRLSEASGTTITDELGAGHSGSYSGAVTLAQTSPITTDGADTAAYFNGGWGSIPYYSALNPTADKLSIEFWWKGSAPNAARFMVLKGYTSHNDPYYQYGVGDDTTGKVRVVVDTSGSFSPWDTGISWPGDGAWHQVVVTYDGSLGSNNLKLYIDAVQRAQTSKTGNVRGYSSALGLMDILNLGSGFQTTGRLDEVSIYNSALSSTRVSAHFDAALVAPPVPANATLPALSGNAVVGETLSASTGTWSGSPTSYSYQWRRCDSAGANCSDISGATSSSYVVVLADVGERLRMRVTATNATGAGSADSAASTAVPPTAPPANVDPPVVSGTPTQGWTLSVSNGSWAQAPSSYAHQWLRCDDQGEDCVEIEDATGSTYVSTGDDVATTLRARVTAANSLGSTSTASAHTTAVAPLTTVAPPVPAPGPQSPVSYNGAHIIGTRWTAVGDGSYKLEFERDNASWDASIFDCISFSDWPWNTCGNDLQSYDGMGGAYSYHREIWEEFGPSSGAEGELTPTAPYCGDTGIGAPSENQCYMRTWTPSIDVLASGDFVERDGEVIGGSGNYDLSVVADDPRVDFGIENTGIAQVSWAELGEGEMDHADASCASGCPGHFSAAFSVDASTLPEGRHSFVAKATDPLEAVTDGNEWSVTIDRTPPTVPANLALDAIDGSKGIFSWSESNDPVLPDGASGAGLDYYEVRTQTNTDPWTAWAALEDTQATVEPVVTDDVVAVEVRAVDAVGNVSDAGTDSFTITAMPDGSNADPGPTIDTSSPGENQVVDDSDLDVTKTSFGATISTELGSSGARSFTSDVSLGSEQTLEKLDNGTVAIVIPAEVGDPEDSASPVATGPGIDFSGIGDETTDPPASQDEVWQPDAGELPLDSTSLTPAPSVPAPEIDEPNAVASADGLAPMERAQRLVDDGLVVGVVGIPRAIDAEGVVIPARLTSTSNTLTVSIGTHQNVEYPVSVDIDVAFDPDVGSALSINAGWPAGQHPVLEPAGDCPSRARIMLYGSSNFAALLREMAGSPGALNSGPASCARYYVTVVGQEDSATGLASWNTAQLNAAQNVDCPECGDRKSGFVAAADVHYAGLQEEFQDVPEDPTGYDYGRAVRQRMENLAGFRPAKDTWLVNDLPGRHQQGSFLSKKAGPQTRPFIRGLVRGLYRGPIGAPHGVPGAVAVGYVYQGDTIQGGASYINQWKSALKIGAFWKGLRPSKSTPYVNLWIQETFPRCKFVCGPAFGTQVERTNDYFQHPARLAFAARGSLATAAQRFFDATYTPEAVGYWATTQGEQYLATRRLTPEQMRRFFSMQIYATRNWARDRRYPDRRLFLNWNDGTSTAKTKALRERLALRVALAIQGAYSVGGYSLKWACDPNKGAATDRCVVPPTRYGQGSHLPAWTLFGEQWGP